MGEADTGSADAEWMMGFGGESLSPQYISTNWMLLILSVLGLTREYPSIEKACQLWIKRFAKKDGGFDTEGAKRGHL